MHLVQTSQPHQISAGGDAFRGAGVVRHYPHLGLARTIYKRCTYSVFGRELTRYTVIHGENIRSWPTLPIAHKLPVISYESHAIKHTTQEHDLRAAWLASRDAYNTRGGHLRPQKGALLKCELSMVAKTGNNKAQFPKAADST